MPYPLAARSKLEDNRVMTDLSFSLPDDLVAQLQSRLEGGPFADASEYIVALVRRDLEEAADTAWVREKIAEGLASGFIDKDPSEVIEEIIANRRARRA
jgi:antitoxin ParD1/3/4